MTVYVCVFHLNNDLVRILKSRWMWNNTSLFSMVLGTVGWLMSSFFLIINYSAAFPPQFLQHLLWVAPPMFTTIVSRWISQWIIHFHYWQFKVIVASYKIFAPNNTQYYLECLSHLACRISHHLLINLLIFKELTEATLSLGIFS